MKADENGEAQHKPPLLITTAINPPTGLLNTQMMDNARRTVATRFAIFYWAAQGVKSIVIADATGQSVLSGEEKLLLEQAGCSIEQIAYVQDKEKAVQRGKGYAKGQLINFALEHSAVLRSASSFYKCTGKVICRNWQKISGAVQAASLKSIFWTWPFHGGDLRFVDTCFFYCSTGQFRSVVMRGYEAVKEHRNILSEQNVFAERAVAEAVKDSFTPAKFMRPQLSGISGSTDSAYPERWFGDLEANFPCFVER